MKKGFKLITVMLIIIGGVLLSGCSSSEGGLAKCLEKTKKANSMEVNITTTVPVQGKSIDVKMNVKAEDIYSDFKAVVTINSLGNQQDFYMVKNGNKYTMYVKDNTGKYISKSGDASEVGEIDVSKSFEGYIDIINTYPDMFTDKGNNTYELNVPKDKVAEIYRKVSSDSSTAIPDSLKVTFIVGDDGYIKNMNVESGVAVLKTEYLNYNKDFNIVIPN